MSNANVPFNFNLFLEITKLKDDGSNYADWDRNLKLILMASKKACVLDVPLGDPPVPAATQDVRNAWHS